MTQGMPARGSNGLAPLCVKDKRKSQAQAQAYPPGHPAAPTGNTNTNANGHTNGAVRGRENGPKPPTSESGSGSGSRSESSTRTASASPTLGDGCSCGADGTLYSASRTKVDPEPVVIECSEIIRLASQYTTCAGCSAAVKGLLQRPIEELRLVNAVMEEGCSRVRTAGSTSGSGSGRGGTGGGGGGGRRNGKGGQSKCSKGRDGGACRACAGGAAMVDDWLGNRDGGGTGAVSNGRVQSLGNGQHDDHANQSYAESQSDLQFASGTVTGDHAGSSGVPTAGDGPRALYLRKAYLTDRARLDQLLETFPLEGLVKKVQPKGVALRCEIHRRNGGQSSSDSWDWEDAWDRLPADLRLRVATIDVDVLETAMHQATSTHRFCADCKHNVVTAFDILTCKCNLADIDNEDEFSQDLFWPFDGRVGPASAVTGAATGVGGDASGQRTVLSCPLEDVEELVFWHEDFDSREYTRNSQRHAATLEHGQREVRSIVGSVLLSQLRTNYQNHLARVQGEQYLFALVLHAIRTRMDGPGPGLRNAAMGAAGGAWGSSPDQGGPSACSECGGAADPGCSNCGGTGLSLSDLGLDSNGSKKAKSKSKKKRERKARAKAAKKSQESNGTAVTASSTGAKATTECNGHGGSANGSAPSTRSETPRPQPKPKANVQRSKSTSGDPQSSSPFSNLRPSRVASSSGRSRGTAAGDSSARTKAQDAMAFSAVRPRVGSIGMESAGSLLSMLGRGGGPGDGDDLAEGYDGDEGIDEDLVKEMERLRLQKAKTDVQRSRAALRSSLQKNFDQLLVSSTGSYGRIVGNGAR